MQNANRLFQIAICVLLLLILIVQIGIYERLASTGVPVVVTNTIDVDTPLKVEVDNTPLPVELSRDTP